MTAQSGQRSEPGRLAEHVVAPRRPGAEHLNEALKFCVRQAAAGRTGGDRLRKAPAAGVELASRRRMLARLGFVGSVLTENISASRTCRLKNATPQRMRELIRENLDALGHAVDFLERRRVLLYRITSNLIPFASHPVNELRWWDEYADDFTILGRRFRELDIRVSTHPGQFTVLNSPTPRIVEAAIAELDYHARLLDAFETGPSAKIIVHVGGLYAASESVAMQRFCDGVSKLSERVRRRLVVENDDRLFDAEEVLLVARQLSMPVVFDWLHHHANPCRAPLAEVLPAIFETWRPEDGRPKVHLSSQAADAPRGAHADVIDPADALACFASLPPGPFDCMLEAKQKDRALLQLRSDLRTRGVVERDVATQPARAHG